MMLQELLVRWSEIQVDRAWNKGNEQDWLSEELQLLEALLRFKKSSVPGERADIPALIQDRHRRLEEVLRRRCA